MKAKLDKEFLIKNLFWILLGTAGVLLFIQFCIVLVPGSVKTAQDNYNAAQKELEKTEQGKNGKLVNEKFYPPWVKRQNEYRAKKEDVWGKAYIAQNVSTGKKDKQGNDIPWDTPVLTWPKFANNTIKTKLTDTQAFGSPIDADICLEFRNNYHTQIYAEKDRPSMKTFLFPNGAPADFRFPVDGDPQRIFRPVNWKIDENPTPEECWLAQEELCVRREVVLALKEAYDSIALCQKVTDPSKEKIPVPPGAVRFRNRTWELDLFVDKNTVKGTSTIRNINPSGRPQALVVEGLGTVFRLRQNKQSSELKEIRGVLLAPNQTSTLGADTSFDSLNLSQPFEVEQVFDKATSPLKRIEALEIGTLAMSHRIAPVTLTKGPATIEEPKKEGEDTTAGMGMGMGMNMGMYSGGMGMQPLNPDDYTPQNALVRKRYVQVNEQVRRLPIAFSVSIDQAYIPDVLAAVANSRLRIQTTQFHWQHTPNYSPGDATSGMGPGTGVPGMGQPPRQSWDDNPRPMGGTPVKGGGGGPGPGIGMGPFGMGPFGPGGMGPDGSDPGASDTDSVQRNLVELSVYGIASLYNKFTPKPKSD